MRPVALLFLLFLGSEPALAGALEVPVGPRASLWRLPQARPQIVELALQGVEGDLGWLEEYETPGIDQISPRSQGGGTWLLRLHLTRPGSRLAAGVADGVLSLDAVPADAPPDPDAEEPAIEALLGGEAAEIPPPEALPQLRFLAGPAMAFRWEAADYPLSFEVMPQLAPAAGMAGIDEARAKLLAATSADDRAAAALELGWRYREQGWARESRHYIERLAAEPGRLTPAEVALARAQAAISTERWDEARARLVDAHQAGVPTSQLAEALGVVSLASGSPPPALAGRVLARHAATPKARLLAAELMQVGGRFSESAPLLQALLPDLAGEDLQRASLRLGDALLLAGDPLGAQRAWGDAPPELAKFRYIYATVMKAGRTGWVQALPHLRVMGAGEGEVAAEALYLSAQIDAALGIPMDAIEIYGELLDKHGAIARRSDVPALLWDLYAERARSLADLERWYQLAALHRAAWRPALHAHVDDPTVLWDAARGFDALGLPRDAVETLSEGFAVLVERGQRDPEMTLALARLYERDGRPADGIKTLEYLRKEGIPAGMEPEVALLTGRMRIATGEPSLARAALKEAAKAPAQGDEARILLATLDAAEGRCAEAAAPLKELLLSDAGLARWTDAGPYLALCRCMADLGRPEDALIAARHAHWRARSEEEGRYIAYLIALYSDGRESAPAPAAKPKAPAVAEAPAEGAPAASAKDASQEKEGDIWSFLAEEQRKKAAFDAELDARLRN